MDTSERSAFLFRKTSLTIRLRFTPAMACSTRTRSCANFWLAAFSAAVSSRPRTFFFRLAGLLHRRLIPLKPQVLIQDGAGWIAQVLLIGNPLVVSLSGVRPAEEEDLLIRGLDHEHILVRVRLLLATVVKSLFFGVFRPLAAPLRAVDDEGTRSLRLDGPSLQPIAVSFRQDTQVIQGCAENRQELMQPVIRLGGTDTEELTQHHLKRIGLQVDQDKQELVLAL